jgi:hypothetical protein
MINFSIYISWEPYDVVPKHCLVDWTDKEIVKGFSCRGISRKHSSVYTVFNFICITSRSAWKKMGVVHHRQHSTNYGYLETFQNKTLQNLVNTSTVELFRKQRHRWRSERQATLLHICVICLTVHTQLTSGSAFISIDVIGTGSSSTSTSETASHFTFTAWFASWDDVYVSPYGPTERFSEFV